MFLFMYRVTGNYGILGYTVPGKSPCCVSPRPCTCQIYRRCWLNWSLENRSVAMVKCCCLPRIPTWRSWF